MKGLRSSDLPDQAPRDPATRAQYIEHLKWLYHSGALELRFSTRPLPETLLTTFYPMVMSTVVAYG